MANNFNSYIDSVVSEMKKQFPKWKVQELEVPFSHNDPSNQTTVHIGARVTFQDDAETTLFRSDGHLYARFETVAVVTRGIGESGNALHDVQSDACEIAVWINDRRIEGKRFNWTLDVPELIDILDNIPDEVFRRLDTGQVLWEIRWHDVVQLSTRSLFDVSTDVDIDQIRLGTSSDTTIDLVVE